MPVDPHIAALRGRLRAASDDSRALFATLLHG